MIRSRGGVGLPLVVVGSAAMVGLWMASGINHPSAQRPQGLVEQPLSSPVRQDGGLDKAAFPTPRVRYVAVTPPVARGTKARPIHSPKARDPDPSRTAQRVSYNAMATWRSEGEPDSGEASDQGSSAPDWKAEDRSAG